MNRLSAILIVCCALAACMLPAQAASARMPYGSFLTRPVTDVNDLAQLIRQDKVTAQRYANFYGMSNDALADYIEENGKVASISKPGSYVEYFLDNAGGVHRHHKLLPTGTKLLVVNGLPLMDMRCGNPINKALPKVVVKTEPLIQELQPAPAPVQAAPVEVVETPQLLPEPETPAPPAPEPVVQILSESPMEYPTAITSSPGIQELALLLPGLVALGTLGGGSSSDQPVPEPSGLIVLGFGSAGFVLTCCRRFLNR